MKITRQQLRKLIREAWDDPPEFTDKPEASLMRPSAKKHKPPGIKGLTQSGYVDFEDALKDMLDSEDEEVRAQGRELASDLIDMPVQELPVYEVIRLTKWDWKRPVNDQDIKIPIPKEVEMNVLNKYRASEQARKDRNYDRSMIDYLTAVDDYYKYIEDYVAKNYPGYDISEHAHTSGGKGAKEVESALSDYGRFK